MGLVGLDAALSGLRVSQQQLDVISNNISNVNTPGYTRKILPQQTRVIEGESIGVFSNPTIRNVDLNLARDFWTQVSTVEFFNVQRRFFEEIQEFHGPPDLEVSVAAEISQLRDRFGALADSPEDTFLQRTTVEQAILVANKINDLSDLLTRQRNDAQDQLDISVDRINDKLIEIAELNKQIKFNNVANISKADLEDARDEAVRELSEELDISFFTRGDGVMVVQTARGVQLVDERAETVFFNKTPLGVASFYPTSAAGIFVGNPITTTTAIEVTTTGLGGKVGGLLDLRDRILPENQAMLDELAHKMAQRFEEQGLRLFTDGAGNIPTDSLANLLGTVDLQALAPGAPLSTAGGAPWAPGVTDTFTITLDIGNGSTPPETLTINLTAAEAAFPIPVPSPDGATALVSHINAQIATLPGIFQNTTASLDANGQLNIVSDGNITIDASGAGEMGSAGLAFIGLTAGTEFAAPETGPTLTPVPYVGFSSVIRVNENIVADNRLVQQGTAPTDIPVQDGSNEVIRRIIEFVFSDVEYQQAISGVDLRASGQPTTLQQWLGIYSENRITTTQDLTGFSTTAVLMDTASPPLVAATNDTFRLTFEEARLGLGPFDVDISLSAADLQPGANAAERIVAEINAQIAALPVDPYLTATASVNAFGQIVFESRGNITINADPPAVPNPMLQNGLDALGLTAGVYQTTDPFLEVQVGNDPPTRVIIEADDDETDLISKLNLALGVDPDGGVPGLAVDFDANTGELTLRPGDDPTNPAFGGDFRITGGPFSADGTGIINTLPASGPGVPAVGPGTVNVGDSLIHALFGNDAPVTNVQYASQTSTGSVAFRTAGLGPNAEISTGIISSTTLIDYAQKMVNQQSSELLTIEGRITDETAFRDLLQRRLLDESGVNIDEELSNLIIVQTAYAAAARVITAIDEQFQELLNAI